jgi:hypothetical protein
LIDEPSALTMARERRIWDSTGAILATEVTSLLECSIGRKSPNMENMRSLPGGDALSISLEERLFLKNGNLRAGNKHFLKKNCGCWPRPCCWLTGSNLFHFSGVRDSYNIKSVAQLNIGCSTADWFNQSDIACQWFSFCLAGIISDEDAC